MMTLIFFLLGILTGLVIAFIIGQFALKKGYKEDQKELIEFWKEKNEQGQQIIEALWEIREVIIDLRR